MQSALGEVRMAMLSDRGSTPLISTNAYYGNGLASHTVKNLVNMRVLGFLKQSGRFTPFLFSCLFCALFAHFLQNQQGQFCALFKILESRAPSGFATFFAQNFNSFLRPFTLNFAHFFTLSFYPGNDPVFPAYPG